MAVISIGLMVPGSLYTVKYSGTDPTTKALTITAKLVVLVGTNQARLEGLRGTVTIDQSRITQVSTSAGPATDPA